MSESNMQVAMSSDDMESLINALACAIASLDHSDGGYSQDERYQAKVKLMKYSSDMLSKWKALKV